MLQGARQQSNITGVNPDPALVNGLSGQTPGSQWPQPFGSRQAMQEVKLAPCNNQVLVKRAQARTCGHCGHLWDGGQAIDPAGSGQTNEEVLHLVTCSMHLALSRAKAN